MVNIKVIYQDEDILGLDKPPYLVVESADTVKNTTLADILQRDFGIKLLRGGIVHRLDKDTSGIILVAKTQEALDSLQNQFKERKTKKEYLALVHGHIIDEGRVDAAIVRNPKNREKFTAVSPGRGENPVDSRVSPPSRWPNGLLEGERWAVTEYEPLQRLEISEKRLVEIFSGFNKIQFRKLYAIRYLLFTLVACRPLTGRTHQIRVHLKYIGHPIVADEKYVGRKMYRLDKRWCPRIFLHAKRIGFYHPISGRWMELESELPDDLKKALDLLNE